MKLLLVGLWVTLVALGAAYGGALYGTAGSDRGKAASAVVLQSQKTRVINVPIVVEGLVRGFVAAQFTFTMDASLSKTMQVSPDVYLLDEAFRTLYADAALDPQHVAKYDLPKLTAHLVASTNERLGAPLIKDVLIENLSYIEMGAGKT